jgi:penicillin-binding protein 1A
MQKKLRDQYQSGSRKKFLDSFTTIELERLSLTEQGSQVRLHRMFDWSGFYTDSISVSDSLRHSITLLHAGLIAIDPATGAVKAWVGGIDFKTQPYDQVLARRQLASTFKPILFATAFEEGIEPCQYLDNVSVTIPEFEDWTPENFDHTYGGKYSLAGALANSMNVPTFNLYTNIGFQKVDSMWKNMGFLFPLDNTPSLALGTAEANIKEVALAYASFANGGLKISPYNLVSIKTSAGEVIWENEVAEPSDRIINEKTSLLIGAILQKAVREGTGASMAYKYGVTLPLAGKTGTSQDYSDAWFAAFNPKLVIVSRVGASSPAIHFYNGSDGSGSGLALPLVALTLKKVQENPELRKELIKSFPELPAEVRLALECPDFKEDNILDKFLDIFKNDQIIFDDGKKEPKKKRSFFRRLFKK